MHINDFYKMEIFMHIKFEYDTQHYKNKQGLKI
jgi:hypothetical protein